MPLKARARFHLCTLHRSAYGWIDGIKYWNEVICKSVRLQYEYEYECECSFILAVCIDCYCYWCWCMFPFLGLFCFNLFRFILCCFCWLLFALSFHLLNHPKRATNIENVCRIFVYYSPSLLLLTYLYVKRLQQHSTIIHLVLYVLPIQSKTIVESNFFSFSWKSLVLCEKCELIDIYMFIWTYIDGCKWLNVSMCARK